MTLNSGSLSPMSQHNVREPGAYSYALKDWGVGIIAEPLSRYSDEKEARRTGDDTETDRKPVTLVWVRRTILAALHSGH